MNSNGSWWQLVADLLDTVHHEKDSMVHSQYVYKSTPVTEVQLILEKEPVGQSTRWICNGSDNEILDS